MNLTKRFCFLFSVKRTRFCSGSFTGQRCLLFSCSGLETEVVSVYPVDQALRKVYTKQTHYRMTKRPESLLFIQWNCQAEWPHVLVPIVYFSLVGNICVRDQVTRNFFLCVHLEVEDTWSIRDSMLREWEGWAELAVWVPRTSAD